MLFRASSFLPPSLNAILFENHWTWWAAVFALAVILLYVARSRDNQRLRRTGQVVLGLALLWTAAALLVATPVERLHAAHTDLAASVNKMDLDRVFTYFESDFSVPQLALRGEEMDGGKAHLAVVLKTYGIKESRITDFEATMQTDGTAVSRFTVWTSYRDGFMKTTWQLSWNDEPGADWRIQHARLLKIADQDFPVDALIR